MKETTTTLLTIRLIEVANSFTWLWTSLSHDRTITRTMVILSVTNVRRVTFIQIRKAEMCSRPTCLCATIVRETLVRTILKILGMAWSTRAPINIVLLWTTQIPFDRIITRTPMSFTSTIVQPHISPLPSTSLCQEPSRTIQLSMSLTSSWSTCIPHPTIIQSSIDRFATISTSYKVKEIVPLRAVIRPEGSNLCTMTSSSFSLPTP